MPRIPIENDRGPTNLGLVPQSPSRAAAGEAAGIRVGEAARELGETITSVGASVTRDAVQKQQRKDFVDAQTTLLEGMNALREQVESGEQFEHLGGEDQGVAPIDRPLAFRERFEDLFSKTTDGLDERTQTALRARLMPFVVGEQTKIAEQAEVDQQAIALRDLPAQENALLRTYREAESAEVENAAENGLVELYEGLGLSEAQTTKLVNAGLHEAQVGKAQSHDPSLLISLSESGNFQEIFPRISPEEERVLVEQARVKRERGQEIINDRKLESFTLTVREIDQQLDDGIIGPAKGRRYKEAIRSQVATGGVEAAMAQHIEDVLHNGAIPNPGLKIGGKSVLKGGVNNFYQQRLVPLRESLTEQLGPVAAEEVFWDRVGAFSAKVHMVPDAARGELVETMRSALSTSGSGSQAALASQTILNFKTRYAPLAEQFGQEAMLMARDFQSRLLARGQGNLQVVSDDIRQIYDIDDGKRKVMRDRLSEELRVELNEDWLNGSITKITRFGEPEEAPFGMVSQFDDLVRTNYMLNGGNIETARAGALDMIESRWTISNINKEPEWMQHAPDNLSTDRGVDWMKSDLHRDVMRIHDLQQTSSPDATDFPPNFDANKHIRIDTDVFTARGDSLTYPVHIITDGGYVPLRDDTGELVYFAPNPLTSETLAMEREQAALAQREKEQAFQEGRNFAGFMSHLGGDFRQAMESLPRSEPTMPVSETLSRINEHIIQPIANSDAAQEFINLMARPPSPPDPNRDPEELATLMLGPVIYPLLKVAEQWNRLGDSAPGGAPASAPSGPTLAEQSAERRRVVTNTLDNMEPTEDSP